ncbi:hypothetical protein L873DRAFT_1775367 [Choiromyces venosus 120613-1]|uniref:Uncharacterized protein n=1 Tax=Choiromyces venosus 120613-1 TaxID=1336337 RepID=A0A3N4JDF5_9PEZI|nr:hypothetical protein L873DRAFT_1775367 [Choiromyces venosus 120613-1]
MPTPPPPSTTTTPTSSGSKQTHRKALAEIEEEARVLREMIANKKAEKATLQAVHDSLRKRGDGERGKG